MVFEAAKKYFCSQLRACDAARTSVARPHNPEYWVLVSTVSQPLPLSYCFLLNMFSSDPKAACYAYIETTYVCLHSMVMVAIYACLPQ